MKNHYASDDIDGRRKEVLERKAELLLLASSRRNVLEDSYKLQQFLRDVDEVKAWAQEKLKTATDESYRVCPSFPDPPDQPLPLINPSP